MNVGVSIMAGKGFTSDTKGSVRITKENSKVWRTLVALIPITVTSYWIYSAEDPQVRAKLLWTVPLRLTRNIATATLITSGILVFP